MYVGGSLARVARCSSLETPGMIVKTFGRSSLSD